MDPTAIFVMVAKLAEALTEALKLAPNFEQRIIKNLRDKLEELSEIREELNEHLAQDVSDPRNTRDDNKIAFLKSKMSLLTEEIDRYTNEILVYLKRASNE